MKHPPLKPLKPPPTYLAPLNQEPKVLRVHPCLPFVLQSPTYQNPLWHLFCKRRMAIVFFQVKITLKGCEDACSVSGNPVTLNSKTER